jgi:hypothetical protein
MGLCVAEVGGMPRTAGAATALHWHALHQLCRSQCRMESSVACEGGEREGGGPMMEGAAAVGAVVAAITPLSRMLAAWRLRRVQSPLM